MTWSESHIIVMLSGKSKVCFISLASEIMAQIVHLRRKIHESKKRGFRSYLQRCRITKDATFPKNLDFTKAQGALTNG